MDAKYIDGWFYFSCVSEPVRIEKGHLPNPPYKIFKTRKVCIAYIEEKKDEKAKKTIDHLFDGVRKAMKERENSAMVDCREYVLPKYLIMNLIEQQKFEAFMKLIKKVEELLNTVKQLQQTQKFDNKAPDGFIYNGNRRNINDWGMCQYTPGDKPPMPGNLPEPYWLNLKFKTDEEIKDLAHEHCKEMQLGGFRASHSSFIAAYKQAQNDIYIKK